MLIFIAQLFLKEILKSPLLQETNLLNAYGEKYFLPNSEHTSPRLPIPRLIQSGRAYLLTYLNRCVCVCLCWSDITVQWPHLQNLLSTVTTCNREHRQKERGLARAVFCGGLLLIRAVGNSTYYLGPSSPR